MTVFGHLWKLERRASIHLCLQHPATAVPVTPGLPSQRFQILSLIAYLFQLVPLTFKMVLSQEKKLICVLTMLVIMLAFVTICLYSKLQKRRRVETLLMDYLAGTPCRLECRHQHQHPLQP